MPSKNSVPAKDKTGEPLLGPLSNATPAPDGAPARAYHNQGDGLSKETGKSYAETHGLSTATSGKKSIPAAYKK